MSKWLLSLETAVSSIILKLQLQLSYSPSIAKHNLCNATKIDALLVQRLHFSSVIMPPIALAVDVQHEVYKWSSASQLFVFYLRIFQ